MTDSLVAEVSYSGCRSGRRRTSATSFLSVLLLRRDQFDGTSGRAEAASWTAASSYQGTSAIVPCRHRVTAPRRAFVFLDQPSVQDGRPDNGKSCQGADVVRPRYDESDSGTQDNAMSYVTRLGARVSRPSAPSTYARRHRNENDSCRRCLRSHG